MPIQPYQPCPNVVQLVVQYENNNELVENVLHYSNGAAPTTTTMNALIDAYIAWEVGHGVQLRNQNTFLVRCIATDLSSATGAVVDRQVLPPTQGTVAGAFHPNNVTIAVAVRTPLRGRSYRGRIFHIGMAEPMTLQNQLVIAFQASFVTFYTLLLTLGVAPIYNLGVLSRNAGGFRRPTGVWTQATAITLDVNLDSQRRRLPGHNRHR